MDAQERMMDLLREAEEAAPEVRWELLPPDHVMTSKDPTVKAYRGNSPLWVFTIISFSIVDQGFPAGSRGYDGTGVRSHDERHRGAVLHLTRPLAEKLFKLAASKVEPPVKEHR